MADTIYINADVWTGNPREPQASAIAVSGEKIVDIGDQEKVFAHRGPKTTVIDLQGKFVVPGFVDNHTHIMTGGFQLSSVQLRDAASPQEFSKRIAAYAAKSPKGQWITGGSWDHELWGGELPHRQWIDAATADHPVFVERLDLHMGLANTVALKLAGITSDTPDPDGGTIVRDPRTGEATGMLRDEAMNLVYQVMPAPTDQQMDEALNQAMRHAAANGITQVHDMGLWPHLAAYRRAHQQKRLLMRIYAFVPLSGWQKLSAFISENGKGDNWLRWGGLKGFVDGSLGSTTAWFYQPYDDAPGTSGLTITEPEILEKRILQADSAGLHIAIHAIGDRANDWLLQAYAKSAEANGPRDRRFRIEHSQHLTRAAIAQFSELGVVPSVQPYHAIDDGRWAEKRIGPERIKTTYPFRSLLDQKARVTFGSDWTVAPLSPLLGIHAAVTRQTIDGAYPDGWVPQEKITVEEALTCYTGNNAWAGFQENIAGSLEPGKLADFVVLSENPLKNAPESIKDIKVMRTIVGGNQTYLNVN